MYLYGLCNSRHDEGTRFSTDALKAILIYHEDH